MNQIETAQFIVDTYSNRKGCKVVAVERSSHPLEIRLVMGSGKDMMVAGWFAQRIRDADDAFKATARMRWATYRFPDGDRKEVLQQLFSGDDGSQEWRAVPTEDVDGSPD